MSVFLEVLVLVWEQLCIYVYIWLWGGRISKKELYDIVTATMYERRTRLKGGAWEWRAVTKQLEI